MAIGNVVGSNLFNIFLVLGTSATITPLKLGNITQFDMGVLIFSSVILFVFGLMFGKRLITRKKGLFLVLCYVGYIGFLIYQI